MFDYLPKSMSLNTKIAIGFFFVCLIVIGTVIVTIAYRQIRHDAMRSCILSLERSAGDVPISHWGELNTYSVDDWNVLHVEESRSLIQELVKSRTSDCGRIDEMYYGNDIWGNSIRIAFRKGNIDPFEIRFVSLGPDGTENTIDDISSESLSAGGNQ